MQPSPKLGPFTQAFTDRSSLKAQALGDEQQWRIRRETLFTAQPIVKANKKRYFIRLYRRFMVVGCAGLIGGWFWMVPSKSVLIS